jgi:FKBP-type peptidyl-prolyl cis-trans isomerase
MKQLSMLVLLSSIIFSCGDDHQGKVEKIKFKNDKEKLSYALGVNHALYSLKRFGLSPEDFDQNKLIEGFSKELKKEYVIDSNCMKTVQLFLGNGQEEINDRYAKEGSRCFGKMCAQDFMKIWNKPGSLEKMELEFVKIGFADVIQKKALSLTENIRDEFIRKFYESTENELSTRMLDSVRVKKNIDTLENDIILETIQLGIGESPNDSSDVLVDFILSTPWGDTMENSYKKLRAQRIEPIFNVKENTRGLEKALLKMKVGGKYRVYLPYSAQNNPIESKKLPFQYIIYQIELKNVGAKGSLVKTQVSNEKVSAIK